MAGLRKLGINAIRANPNVIGYSLTGTEDQGLTGEGLTTTFRELKPGTIDAMFDACVPLRWCLFVEPVQVYRGQKARLEAVLANEDVLRPGEYPVRLQVVGPDGERVFDRDDHGARSPIPPGKPEPPFALPRVLPRTCRSTDRRASTASWRRSSRARPRRAETSNSTWPIRPTCRRSRREVVLWGDDADLAEWLAEHGIKTRPFAAERRSGPRGDPCAGNQPAAGGAAGVRANWPGASPAARRPCSSRPEVFKKGDNADRLAAAGQQGQPGRPAGAGSITRTNGPRSIRSSTACPPAACWTTRSIARSSPTPAWTGQDRRPKWSPARSTPSLRLHFRTDGGGLSTWAPAGSSLNTLRIRENLGSDPVAERLLRNMLRYAARDVWPSRRPTCRPISTNNSRRSDIEHGLTFRSTRKKSKSTKPPAVFVA